MRGVVIVKRQCDLLDLVRTFRSLCRSARRLHGRKQQRNQDADDGNHYKQFDQRETV
jgi:hypothetical protein